MSNSPGNPEKAQPKNNQSDLQDRPETLSLRTLAMPADTNPNGDIFGGWILSQMDLAGGTYAFHIAEGRVATVAITGMQFLKPVYVGDEISVYCGTEKCGTTSITVNIEAWVRRSGGGYIRKSPEEKVTEGLFTFVAIDKHGKPRAVNGDLAGETNSIELDPS